MSALSCYSLISIPQRYLDIHGNWICNTTATPSQAAERTCYRYHAYGWINRTWERSASNRLSSYPCTIKLHIVTFRMALIEPFLLISRYRGVRINCIIMWNYIQLFIANLDSSEPAKSPPAWFSANLFRSLILTVNFRKPNR